MNDAIPVADEDSVCSAQVWLTLRKQVQGSDTPPGRGHPSPTPTYLLRVEFHEAHHVAIFLESDKEVHHRGEGKYCKHCRESVQGRPGNGWGLRLQQEPRSNLWLCAQPLPAPTPQVT